MTGSPSQFTGRGGPSDRRGSIIVLVLVFVVLLTFIVVAFLGEATARIKYYGLFHNRDDLRTDAYSAMEITLATINQYREIEGSLWGPEQGWNRPLEEFGYQPANANSVTVTFEDESGKLPLQSMDTEALLLFFEVLGFDLPEREALTDGLLDWIDEDDIGRLNGFDGEDYEDLDPPYKAANSPPETWDEFRLIKPFDTLFFDESGRPDARWRTFRESVSLFHTGNVNINGAPDTVLRYLDERGQIAMRSFLDFRSGRDGIPGTADDRLLRPDSSAGYILEGSSGVSTEITLLRVKVSALRGEARFDLEALVSWAGSDAGAADARSPDSADTRTEEADNPADDSATARRRRARGDTRTSPAVEAELGYPFRFLRLTENRKF
jgi:general secretion pathway protein K